MDPEPETEPGEDDGMSNTTAPNGGEDNSTAYDYGYDDDGMGLGLG